MLPTYTKVTANNNLISPKSERPKIMFSGINLDTHFGIEYYSKIYIIKLGKQHDQSSLKKHGL